MENTHEMHRIWLAIVPLTHEILHRALVVFIVACGLLHAKSALSVDITIDTVLVGNAGNVNDIHGINSGGYSSAGFGGVAYEYRIGKYEITNEQYATFLNAVAAADPHLLYSQDMGIVQQGSSGGFTYSIRPDAVGQGPGATDYSYAHKPVEFVDWASAIRFANWLHNGQGSGDTESGAYTLIYDTFIDPFSGEEITFLTGAERSANAQWFIPTRNEWYKAAYHKNDGVTGNYWDYPTSSDVAPDDNLPSSDTGNSANFGRGFDDEFALQDVGSYSLSPSPYGTYDQGGNLAEWGEDSGPHGLDWELGGNYQDSVADLDASHWVTGGGGLATASGFRVARPVVVPEPSSLALFALGFIALCCLSRQRWVLRSRTRAN